MSDFPNIGKSDLNPFSNSYNSVSKINGMIAGSNFFENQNPSKIIFDPIIPNLPNSNDLTNFKKQKKIPGEPNNDNMKIPDFE